MEGRILFFTCAAHALTHVYMVIYSVVLGRMSEDFGTDVTDFCAISTVLFGLGALPASWLGEKLGEKTLLVAFFFLTALGGAVVGTAQTLTQLAIGMALLGLGTSIFHPVGNTLIAKGIRSPGKAMGTNGMWGSHGEAVGPLLAGLLAWGFGSWRSSYLALTLPTILLGAWLWATRMELARPEPTKAVERNGERPLLVIALLLAAMMCGGFQFWIVKTVLPDHIGQRTSAELLPTTLQENPVYLGAALSSLMYFVGGFGQMAAGKLVHTREGRGLYAVIFLVSIPLLLLTGALAGVPLVASGCIMTFLLFSAQPVENVLLARWAPPAWKGLLFGLKFTLAFGVGGLGLSIAKRVREAHGLGATFTAASVFTLAALLCALAARALRTGPKVEAVASMAGTMPDSERRRDQSIR